MTGLERHVIRCAIDEAVRLRIATHRECTRCSRELVLSEFSNGRRWCKTCEAIRVRERRRWPA